MSEPPADPSDERTATIVIAERASAELHRLLAGKPDDAPLDTDARSLRGLAAVLDVLRQEVGRCAGERCMGRAVDGIKLWVTQDRFLQERDRAVDAEARATRLEAALRAIADAGTGADAFDMLVDWQQQALSMRHVADAALECG